jgi:hypothetical protein
VRLLLDENLSPKLAAILREQGHDAVAVVDVGFRASLMNELSLPRVCKNCAVSLFCAFLIVGPDRRWKPNESVQNPAKGLVNTTPLIVRIGAAFGGTLGTRGVSSTMAVFSRELRTLMRNRERSNMAP